MTCSNMQRSAAKDTEQIGIKHWQAPGMFARCIEQEH